MPRASIEFVWPYMLWALLAVPAAMLFYQRIVARRNQSAGEYRQLEIVGGAPGANSQARRALPPTLMLLALVLWLLALARPEAAVSLPSHVESIILAMDVSGSMRADDLKPNRLKAVQDTAHAFIAEQPKGVRIGIVEIASTAAVTLAPTTDHEALDKAIDNVQLQKGTALGTGILVSLATLLPDAGIDVEQILTGRPSPPTQLYGLTQRPKVDREASKPVPPGSNGAAAIVLLSDGSSNVGPDPLKMADMAAEKGVRVYTVGIGTPEGSTLKIDGWSIRVRLEEDTLKKIALNTNADYFRGATARDLKKIYANLATRLAMEKQQNVEISAVFAALGALFAGIGGLLSLLWFNRVL